MAVLNELTDSLVSEILIKLPVESLKQCICVCKTWYNLVSDPHFIRSHLSQKLADEKEYLVTGLLRDLYVVERYSFRCYETFFEKLKVKSPIYKSKRRSRIAGCCNGLLLLLNYNSYDSDMYLWNPSLGKIKPLPSAHATYKNKFHLEALGLAFLPEVCDYKVFRMLKFSPDAFCVAEIYSLRTDSWRRIETPGMEISPLYNIPLSAAVVNPFFYWVGTKYLDGQKTNFILSFNMECETFSVISLPDDCLVNGGMEGSLAVFQESLYVFASQFDEFDEGWSLWMMEENCSSEMSWLKICTFKYPNQSLVGFLKNGDVIMEATRNFKVYLHDPRNVSNPRNTEFEISWGQKSSEVYKYSPSLALLDQRNGGV